jgi:hypothetical protein
MLPSPSPSKSNDSDATGFPPNVAMIELFVVIVNSQVLFAQPAVSPVPSWKFPGVAGEFAVIRNACRCHT